MKSSKPTDKQKKRKKLIENIDITALDDIHDVEDIDIILHGALDIYKFEISRRSRYGNWERIQQYRDALLVLIKKASIQKVDSVLQKDVINLGGDDPIFSALIAKASKERINQFLLSGISHENTGLSAIVHWRHGATFNAVINRASPDVINQFLIQTYHDGKTGLCLLGERQNDEGFKAMLEKASPDAINQALKTEDKYGRTAFLFFMGPWKKEGFKLLLEKASSDAISEALLSIDRPYKQSGFFSAAYHQDADNFRALTEKASTLSICTALLRTPPDLVKASNNIRIKEHNIEILNKKMPHFLDILSNFQVMSDHSDSLVTLLKNIFPANFDSEKIKVDDCQLWLNFLDNAIGHAPTDEIKNQLRAICMRLSYIASLKSEDAAKQEKFQEKALKYANEMTSTDGLELDQNLLSQMKSFQHNVDLKNAETYFQAVEDSFLLYRMGENKSQIEMSELDTLLTGIKEDLKTAREVIKKAVNSDEVINALEKFKNKWLPQAEGLMRKESKLPPIENANKNKPGKRFSSLLKNLINKLGHIPWIGSGFSYFKKSKKHDGHAFFPPAEHDSIKHVKSLHAALNQERFARRKK